MLKKYPFLLLLALPVLAFAPIAKDHLLRLDFQVGDSFQLVNKLSMDYYSDEALTNRVVSSKTEFFIDYAVQGLKDEGVYDVTVTPRRIFLDQTMQGMSISYDSDLETQEGMGAMLAPQFDSLIDLDIPIAVNKRGEIVEMPERKAGSNISGADLVESFFVAFPEEAVAVGDQWTDSRSAAQSGLSFNLHYTVKEMDKKTVTLSFQASQEDILEMGELGEQVSDMRFDFNGESTFDRSSGRLISSKYDQIFSAASPQSAETIFIVLSGTVEERS